MWLCRPCGRDSSLEERHTKNVQRTFERSGRSTTCPPCTQELGYNMRVWDGGVGSVRLTGVVSVASRCRSLGMVDATTATWTGGGGRRCRRRGGRGGRGDAAPPAGPSAELDWLPHCVRKGGRRREGHRGPLVSFLRRRSVTPRAARGCGVGRLPMSPGGGGRVGGRRRDDDSAPSSLQGASAAAPCAGPPRRRPRGDPGAQCARPACVMLGPPPSVQAPGRPTWSLLAAKQWAELEEAGGGRSLEERLARQTARPVGVGTKQGPLLPLR